MDVLSAHRAARDELKALLDRWELLFEGDRIAGDESADAGGVDRACTQ